MNRSRINLILGVLLSPITDPEFQRRDYFYERCRAYRELVGIRGSGAETLTKKAQKNREYREACEALIAFLADSCRSKVRSYDDLQMLCDHYYPLLDMERFVRQVQQNFHLPGETEPDRIWPDEQENASLFYIGRMRKIAVSLLTYRDSVMAIRTWNNRSIDGEEDIFCFPHVFDKVEVWNMLNVYVSPDLFMALFIVESGLGEEALYGQKPYISLPDKLLVKVLRKGMAENHLHFNAGFDYEAVWLNKMNLWNCFRTNQQIDGISAVQNMEAALFRFLCAVFFMEGAPGSFPVWVQKFCGGVFLPAVEDLYRGETECRNIRELEQGIWNFFSEEPVKNHADYLLQTVLFSKVELKTSSEFILLYDSCLYIKENPWDTAFARIFLQYIRIKNQFIQKTQQSNLIPGLRHFQKFFNQMKQEELAVGGRETMILDAFRAQSKIDGLKKLEIRIAPDVNLERLYGLDDKKSIEEIKLKLCGQLFAVFGLYRKYILENVMGVQNTQQYLAYEKGEIFNGSSYAEQMEEVLKQYDEEIRKAQIPTLGIVYHFIKTDSADNISGYYCWRDIGLNDRVCSNHRFFLRERMALLGIAIENLRTELPYLNEYIVGIDAASDENAMEPWMFSMAYMKMRSRMTALPISVRRIGNNRNYFNVQNIGFTYHVGEDYRHIVSGLRHIDEVIEYFYYKAGDRLGHALALGVNIREWIRETEVTVMPVQEYMENLLWIWGKSINGEADLPVQLERLEEKIMICAEKIYQNLSGITVRLLYQAYEKKFSSRHRELLLKLKKEEDSLTGTACGSPAAQKGSPRTYCKIINEQCMGYGGLWTLERLVSTVYCPVFEERGKQAEMIPVKENELALYEELQEYLKRKIAQKGIYIETNPTSNLSVGNMKELSEHPIFRLSPVRQTSDQEMSVLVTINSDDPAVFNTNVENELAYVYYALQHAGYAKENILQWIDKIRQNGMDGSFIAKIKNCRTLLEETSRIMDSLEKFC